MAGGGLGNVQHDVCTVTGPCRRATVLYVQERSISIPMLFGCPFVWKTSALKFAELSDKMDCVITHVGLAASLKFVDYGGNK